MIVSGYYQELTVTGDLAPRRICWFISIALFLYLVQELLVGLSEDSAAAPSTNQVDDIGQDVARSQDRRQPR